MFSTLGLWTRIACPQAQDICHRSNCAFGHGTFTTTTMRVPSDELKALAARQLAKKEEQEKIPSTSAGAGLKRRFSSSSLSAVQPSPPKRMRAESAAIPKSPVSDSPPLLLITNPALSSIALPTRQQMLTTLYTIFKDLYCLLPHPHNLQLAKQDALKQEGEVYAKSGKTTYRNAIISAAAQIKKRPKPDSITHPSIGTSSSRPPPPSAPAFSLSSTDLEPLLLPPSSLSKFGYAVEVEGEGGEMPSEEGNTMLCDRCGKNVTIKAAGGEGIKECEFHWGRLFTNRSNHDKAKNWTCCSASHGSIGCQTGPHVFLEKAIQALHRRHPFSPTTTGTLDIAALDCEGIYTTQGMSVARVTVVDKEGKCVFDELVRPDDGVEVIDFNTRFSGITSLEKAIFNLSEIRTSLNNYIGAQTILIGHSLDSDMSMLRMIHSRVVDTSILFPHPGGLPYRRALRNLTKEYLNRVIQMGDENVGHDPVEDALAALDLVKFYVKREKLKKEADSLANFY